MNINDNESVDIVKIVQQVDSQIADIQELEDKVTAAFEKARNANNAASYAHREIGVFKTSRKEGIERLQQAALGLSEAQISTIEAQKILMEYQKKTAQILKGISLLGCSNIATNRAVQTRIFEILKGGSTSDLSDLAKQELTNLIKELKSQEDAFLVQRRMQEEIKSQKKSVEEQRKAQIETEQKQKNMDERLEQLMRRLDESEKRNEELEILREKERERELKEEAEKRAAEEKAAKEKLAREKALEKANTEKALQREKERKEILSKPKSKIVAGLLAIFFGYVGAQWFYLGKPLRAVVYLIAYMFFIPMWLAYIVEGIFFLCAKQETFDKYRSWSKKW